MSALLSPYVQLVKIGQELATGLQQLFEPIQKIKAAFDAIPREQIQAFLERWSKLSDEFWRKLAEDEREAFALFARLGLASLETLLTDEQVQRILELQRQEGDTAALTYILSAFQVGDYKLLDEMVEGWYEVPYMAARRKAISSATNAHKRGEYELAIPTLLPLIDGLSAEIEVTLPVRAKKLIKVKHVAKEYSKIEPELSSECLVQVVEKLIFQEVDLRNPQTVSGSNNRDGILHGRVSDYGTEQHSYQVMLLLNMTVAVYQRLVPAAPTTAPSVAPLHIKESAG